MTATSNLHANFLAEIRERIAVIKSELDELSAVERFHARMAAGDNIAPKADKPIGPVGGEVAPNLSWADAVSAAIGINGGSATVADIMETLLRSGYAAGMDKKVLRATISTALSRKPDRFEKLGDGKWGPSNPFK